MKENILTSEMLLSLIQEVMNEFSCHEPSSGHYTKCEPGAIYSVLDSNDRVGEKFKGRGTVSSRKSDGTYKLASKYGENAKIHLGGIPMIANDMMSYIKSDILVFGIGVLFSLF